MFFRFALHSVNVLLIATKDLKVRLLGDWTDFRINALIKLNVCLPNFVNLFNIVNFVIIQQDHYCELLPLEEHKFIRDEC
jgi:hypothetical protein